MEIVDCYFLVVVDCYFRAVVYCYFTVVVDYYFMTVVECYFMMVVDYKKVVFLLLLVDYFLFVQDVFVRQVGLE